MNQSRRQRNLTIPPVVIYSVMIPALCALLILLIVWQYYSAKSNPAAPAVMGPPSAWETQVGLAQKAARQLDKNAVLYHVIAFPYNPEIDQSGTYTDAYSSPLEVQFLFASAPDNQITVRFQDSAPDATISVLQQPQLAPSGISQEAEKYAEIFAQVSVSPREALLSTWQIAQALAAEEKVDLAPTISLNVARTPVTWWVNYKSPGTYSTYFIVDARDGTIVGRGR